MDLSFVRSMNRHAECYYLCDVYPKLHQATALDLCNAPMEARIYPMAEVGGMGSLAAMLPAERAYVINRTSNHPFHPSNVLLQCALFCFILELQPDVIHFNNLVYFNHFYLFLFRTKLIISIHDPFPHSGEEEDALSFGARTYRFLNRLLVRRHLLYNHTMVEAYANSRNISQDKIISSRLGPYDYLKSICSKSHTEACDFLFFGRIQRYKGIDLLLDAYRMVVKKHPRARLVIAGSGNFWFDPSNYQIPDDNLKIINRFIPGPELADLIEASRVVVCPYRDATQSGVVMSAYAFCKPVIVTDVGALREVVDHGITGVVVPPDDAEALANAMISFYGGSYEHIDWENQIHRIFHVGQGSWDEIAKQLLIRYKES
jgi:glycosyltransferase involved in cell wall biosynthesis